MANEHWSRFVSTSNRGRVCDHLLPVGDVDVRTGRTLWSIHTVSTDRGGLGQTCGHSCAIYLSRVGQCSVYSWTVRDVLRSSYMVY